MQLGYTESRSLGQRKLTAREGDALTHGQKVPGVLWVRSPVLRVDSRASQIPCLTLLPPEGMGWRRPWQRVHRRPEHPRGRRAGRRRDCPSRCLGKATQPCTPSV